MPSDQIVDNKQYVVYFLMYKTNTNFNIIHLFYIFICTHGCKDQCILLQDLKSLIAFTASSVIEMYYRYNFIIFFF